MRPRAVTVRRVVIYSEATLFAGAERAVATLAEALPDDVEVIVGGPHHPTITSIAGARGRTTEMPALARRQDLASSRLLRRRLAALAPAVLHLNKTDVAGLRYVEVVARTVPQLRVVSVVHHVEPVVTLPARIGTCALARRPGAIVAVSEQLARQLERILLLPAGRVAAIRNAVPPPGFHRRPEPGRPFTVGVLCRLVSHKGVGDVLRAAASIDGSHLLIGGEGPDRPRLEELSRQLGLEARTRFLGWVPPETVLAHCDVLASPARIEGYPLTLLDAQAIGLPVVAADVGGVSEVLEGDPNAITVPPGDIERLTAALRSIASRPPTPIADPFPDGLDSDAVMAMAEAYLALYWPAAQRSGAKSVPDPTPGSASGAGRNRSGRYRGSWRRPPLRAATRWAAHQIRPRSVVLMYHGVSDVDVDPWGLQVSPRNFAAHLEVLRRRLGSVALPDLVDGAARSSDTRIAVTFDDGYANILHQALPLLERFEVPATLFAVTSKLAGESEHWWDELARAILRPVALPDHLKLSDDLTVLLQDAASQHEEQRWAADQRYRDGDPSPSARMALYLRLWERLSVLDDETRSQRLAEINAWAGDPGQVRETHRSLGVDELCTLARGGLVDIGSHTATHPLLPQLDTSAMRHELVSARHELEEILTRPITSFSYPFGAHDDTVVAVTKLAGYKLAVTCRPRTVGRSVDPFRIGRFDVKDWDGVEFERRLLRWIRFS